MASGVRGQIARAAALLALALVACAWAPLAGDASTITVTAKSDDTTGGDGHCSLRKALAAAESRVGGDCTIVTSPGPVTIELTAGTYMLSSQLIATAGPDVVIQGTSNATPSDTTLSPNLQGRVLMVNGGATVTLAGLTLTGGKTANGMTWGSVSTGQPPNPGGAGGSGGALSATGTVTINGSTIDSNTAGKGVIGGTSHSLGGRPGAVGGAGGDGGAIELGAGATLTIENSTISRDDAGAGGPGGATGTGSAGGAGGLGGGIHGSGAPTMGLTNVTLGLNAAGDGGPGGPGGSGSVGGAGGTGGAGGSGSAALDQIPAADAGCPATDERGVSRPQPAGGLCDIGAYEYAPPSCHGVTATTTVAAPVAVQLSCTDPAGAQLTYSIDTPPAHGSLATIDQVTGEVTYTPASGYSGADSFTYHASSANGTTTTVTASITVLTPPTCQPVYTNTPFGAPVSVALHCTDPTGARLTYEVAAEPAHGSLGAITTDRVRYTPKAGFSGLDSFTHDAKSINRTATIAPASITVGAPPPAFTDLRVLSPQHGHTVAGTLVLTESGSTFTAALTTTGHKPAKLATLTKRRLRSGVLTFALKLTKRGRSLLSHHGKLKLRLKVTVTPRGAQAQTASRTVTLKR